MTMGGTSGLLATPDKLLLGASMNRELWAFYAGPDQVMTVTSGLASLLGLLLIFWNKVVAAFFKFLGLFRKHKEEPTTEPKSTH